MGYANAEEFWEDVHRFAHPTLHAVMRDGGTLCGPCLNDERELITAVLSDEPGTDPQWEVVDVATLDGKHPMQPESVMCSHCSNVIRQGESNVQS